MILEIGMGIVIGVALLLSVLRINNMIDNDNQENKG